MIGALDRNPTHLTFLRFFALSEGHIIAVAPSLDGWTWKLIDGQGHAAAAGLAPHQEAAMALGWQAARSITSSCDNIFPEIILGDQAVSRRARS